ncbi:MAG: AAA family ATPase [Candidatus Aminicenantes bacterium]|nr:AAA family ATPase [Candidatus Aminicenantes bacterium]
MKEKTVFEELSAEKLRWRLEPDAIPFSSTDDCKPCDEIIGQERALKAILTGLDIKSLGYNIFITGLVGTGRTTTIKQLLERLEKEERTPDDILYVNNFKNPDEPSLIILPPGQGRLFKDGMTALIDMLKVNIPMLLKSKYYTEKREAIIESQQKKQKEILQKFEGRAAEHGFAVVQVQMGLFVKPDLVPVIEGRNVTFRELEAMVKDKKFEPKDLDDLKKKYEQLTSELEGIFESLREIDEETRMHLKSWDAEAITPIIRGGIAGLKERFPQAPIADYLSLVEENLINHIDLFKAQKKDEKEERARELTDAFLEYRVNLLVDNSEVKGAPVVMETNPNYINLFGTIESAVTRMGIWQTDFTKIKAGSFLKANGGYLVINALDALTEPGVWLTLKRTLRYLIFEIQNYMALYLISTSRLKPQPIKCQVKVVMIGDSHIYNLLYFLDEDFKKIFKIKAEFDSEMTKDERTIRDYARFVKKICDDDGLFPVDKGGIAAIIEYGTRIAGRQRKVSTRFHVLADVAREANYWAKMDQKKTIGREHVEKAVHERFERISLVEDKIQEMIEEGTILIDTEGREVGQVNGLSVYDMGQFAFGKPTRITAKTAVGRGGVINIEREADLSGPTHNKGVLILGGYLRGKYAQKTPFSLSASIALEQSYSGVDGDSASSTEVYAILSSLSRLPIRQDIAVTGSINQKGEIQAIGGVNEKIEGFFDVCRAKELTGAQGVIIPRQNVQNLMLREDVVEAVADGRFHVYPISTVDEGMEILTGIEAGAMRKDGTYEEGTVNQLVSRELERLAASWKAFAGPADRER